jgi:hypothetical protein
MGSTIIFGIKKQFSSSTMGDQKVSTIVTMEGMAYHDNKILDDAKTDAIKTANKNILIMILLVNCSF